MAKRRRRSSAGRATGGRLPLGTNRALVAAVVALLVSVASYIDHRRKAADGPAAEHVDKRPGTVTRVIDGDTIDVVVTEGQPPVGVRLLGIDAPEMRGPSREHGLAAEAYVKARCEGKTVTLRMDELQRERDKYGRLLAYVYLANDELLNESITRDGLAFAHRTLRCDLSSQLEAAENEARAASRGLWESITVAEMPEWRQKWMAERGLK